jgi:hypothetical protein
MKSVKIAIRLSKTVNRRTDNSMTNEKGQNTRKSLQNTCRKLTIEQHEPHYKKGVN